jgi:GT2 family glycosyltransferase/2-polyprenyl-3-methyl-5-hydroxy-6-metoxy-1,4-benzoquinol methylase
VDRIYNSYFFTDFYEKNGGGNYMDDNLWKPFFERVAEQIIKIWNPRNVLDAGCAKGYLVEALRDKGVDAYGIDISEFAISHVREDLKPYCCVQSISESLPKTFPEEYDLITCIEVLEHLYPETAVKAIANLCRYTDRIVFSSTPNDIEDQTHVNVQLPEYWSRIYAKNLFYKSVFQKMEWLSPWAALYEKRDDISNVVNEYERKLRIIELQNKKRTDELLMNLQSKENDLVEQNNLLLNLQETEQMVEVLKEEKINSTELLDKLYTENLQKQTDLYDEIQSYIKKISTSEEKFKKSIEELEKKIISDRNSDELKAQENRWRAEEIRLNAELNYYRELASFENIQKERVKEAYDSICNATMWKATRPLRRINDFIKNGFKPSEEFKFEFESFAMDKNQIIAQKPLTDHPKEHLWPDLDWNNIGASILNSQQNELARGELELQLKDFKYIPLISVIVPLYNAPMKWLPRVIETLQAQIYPYWELCVVDDGSPEPEGREYMKTMAKFESRIKFASLENNGGISAASNEALKMAKGEYIALIDQDDEITPDAFFWMIKRINEFPETDFIYSDECKLDTEATVKYFDFYFKPDWSPRLLMNHMYTGHLTMYRTTIVKMVGGFRSKFDFSQDYDLALRVSDVTKNIEHVERILYFWRAISTSAATGAKDFARVGNMHALKDWYNRHNLNVVMQMMPRGNYGRIVRQESPIVSIIIPSDNEENLSSALHGLMEMTNYGNLELIPVTNSKLAIEIEKEFSYLEEKLQICRYDKKYNFSDKCNEGAKQAKGSICLFYNDDVLPTQKDWLDRLLDILELPDVGSVSPMLTNPDQMIQYAGMVSGTPGLVGTAFNGYPADDYIYSVFNHYLLRDVTILSGACFAIKKIVFEEVGGFDSLHTPNGHSDVDLSFKIIDKGYYNVYTPYSRLIHMGNHTWHETEKKDKSDIYCLKHWNQYLSRDCFFTDAQKKMYYTDFRYLYKIYTPREVCNSNTEGKDILLVTHELSLTGAPIVLLSVARFAVENQFFPVVLSFKDGPLRKQYEQMGITVIIDESVEGCSWILNKFIRNFDIVFVNTVVCYPVIELLRDSLPKVYWWLHEGEYAINFYNNKLPRELGKNITVLYGGEYVKQVLGKYAIHYSGQCLFYAVDDECSDMQNVRLACTENDNKTYRILFVGSIEHRKGSDVLLQAIQKLEDWVMNKCEFLFIGAEFDPVMMNDIVKFSKIYGNIKVLEPVDHKKLQYYYKNSDMLIVPSRDDPCPVVAVEAMMHFLPVICSDKTGTSYLIKDRKNGFIFENENAEQIAEIITSIIKKPSILKEIGDNGRIIYETLFKETILEENLKAIFKGIN